MLGDLLSSLGFRPLDAGGLSVARKMEAMGWLNIQLQMRYNGDWQSTFVLVSAPAGAIAEPATSRR